MSFIWLGFECGKKKMKLEEEEEDKNAIEFQLEVKVSNYFIRYY